PAKPLWSCGKKLTARTNAPSKALAPTAKKSTPSGPESSTVKITQLRVIPCPILAPSSEAVITKSTWLVKRTEKKWVTERSLSRQMEKRARSQAPLETPRG